ncbi:hypothetical protein MRX96_000261 [Rhipicephalus microplus]
MLRSSSIYSPRLHSVPRLTDQQPVSLCGSTPARVRVPNAPPNPNILACQAASPTRGSMDPADITNFIFIDISNSYKAAASRRAALWARWLRNETVL